MNRVRLIAAFIFFSCFDTIIFCQNIFELDTNNCKVIIDNSGDFFRNTETNVGGYEVPKNSGNVTTYMMSYVIAGKDDLSNVHASESGFGLDGEFSPGPISDDYNSSYYLSNFSNSIWKITRAQVNYHVNNYTAVGYVPHASISSWPGNGNSSEGVAEQLAPYVDVNNDQIYDPMDGDYPFFQGDMAVYLIMNDENNNVSLTVQPAFGIESHFLFYQFLSNDDINNTTFLNLKIINRRDTVYPEVYSGLRLDFDLGWANNDYIGSDSSRNLAYVYNGQSTDMGQSGQPGYGSNPPAFGCQQLSEEAGCIFGYCIGCIQPFPGVGVIDDYLMGMQGLSSSGDTLMNDLYPTQFIYGGNPFYGTGWTELTNSNPYGDRRANLYSKSFSLAANEEKCLDFAFIFNQEAGHHIENVNELLFTADAVQNFYDENIYPCNQIFLTPNEMKEDFEFNFYPNPTNGILNFHSGQEFYFTVFDIFGKVLSNDFVSKNQNLIELNYQPGIYFFQINQDGKIHTEKIIITAP